ncbi:NADPH-dependent FMN reductase [Legionella fallonii]|uniref:NADPH-dependent FMN reductase family protein n=1 Tax=Legionella fallonii LLAP-10 TaxID=1212491 RepID=A0A098GBM4_9GAMM|nr:NAD(P)H-dependent oxidoreductase [Legionella fallonii]CEG58881.1 NADPH-dependent FMN reductase family protein [Legionella fallonii LLAP-10]
MSKKIAVIVGSLRRESLNLKMAKVLMSLAPESLKPEIISIGDLPLYNQDLDEGDNIPAAWSKFREQMKSCQGILFVTPEYNRSVPGALKNAIDVGSRPYGHSIWGGKPAAVVSVSPGAIGGFGANHHLRQSFVFLDVPVLQQPEAYIGFAGNLFNDKGELTNEDTRLFLSKLMTTFANWVETIVRAE